MSDYGLVIIIIAYLLVLFLIAYWTESTKKGKNLANSPIVYALSLGVYCSAWTYYGSVGLAAKGDLSFLSTYIGPVIAAPLFVVVLRKVILITKEHNLSTLADLIAFRYGNNRFIGALVTIICLIGILPYIALQIKAVSETFEIMVSQHSLFSETTSNYSTFFITLILAIFAAFFGTQLSDASKRRTGITVSIAFESVLKLSFFLIIGVYVTFFLFNGGNDIYEQINLIDTHLANLKLESITEGINFGYLSILSFFAIFLLPRQFQMGVTENHSTQHLKTATWMFPLYLLLFNLFVVCIAWAGRIKFGAETNVDYYSLFLPLQEGRTFLAVLVFLGGFSASISMIVVSTIALATMISNNLIIPYGYLQRFNEGNPSKNAKYIKSIRRIAIFGLILTAYVFYTNFNINLSLISIGLISFVLIAQVAPAFFLGLYWKRVSSRAVKAGLILGLLTTFYTLLLPFIASVFFENNQFVEAGPWGISMLRPYALFGLSIFTPINHAFFWSMVVNIGAILWVSILSKERYSERNYAELIVNRDDSIDDGVFVWQGEAFVKDIQSILTKFLGEERTNRALDIFFRKYKLPRETVKADARFILFAEKLLAGRIGAASAKILIAKVIREDQISMSELMRIMEENKETISTKKVFEEKSRELAKLTSQLQEANEELLQNDKQKDEFLDTVAHELKTPITSIKAAAEILSDDDDVPAEVHKRFISNMLNDANRLETLVKNILDLEKLSSGREELNLEYADLAQCIQQSLKNIELLYDLKYVSIQLSPQQGIFAYIDENRMIQVFVNLFANALKFIDPVNGEVSIKIEESSDQIVVYFTDNGKGIPLEEAKYIFDKFYQSKDQNKRKPSGSGLGLAICKQIIDRHYGNIRVDTEYSSGAQFIITLPKKLKLNEDTDSR